MTKRHGWEPGAAAEGVDEVAVEGEEEEGEPADVAEDEVAVGAVVRARGAVNAVEAHQGDDMI
jgi:hypothetical protein